ncbi:ENV2 protein, partial [Cephalopterus ornatus]|nr:ENV2 protein [Cephalopterus ornatus]
VHGDTEPLLKLIQAAYHTLNHTDSNVTNSCWLCYDTRPPFYEGIALNTSFTLSNQDSPIQCDWEAKKIGITLQQVRGQGMCIG